MSVRSIARAGTITALVGGSLYALALVLVARARNGFDGFPLDDPWIHLTFARTLREHAVFAYFPGDPATAGSTSPLYTLMLTAGFFVTSNEKLLSYALGLSFHVGFLVALAGWVRKRLGGALPAVLAVLLCGVDARIGLLAASGMETSLFLALVAATFWARASGRPVAAAVAVGAAVWVRPEGLLLAAVLGIDAILARGERRTGLVAPLATFGAIAAGYVAFNLATGGGIVPNTFAAKTAYYGGAERAGFFVTQVLGMWGGGAWLLLAPFVAAGLVREGWVLMRRAASPLRAEAGWVLALPLAYLAVLPFAHRFERYLVPLLPAAAVLGLHAAGATLRRIAAPKGRAACASVLVAGAALLHARAARAGLQDYVDTCRYHQVRHERCGRWLAAHTPADAVIATHDIGAIAFYSRRRVVDTAGIVLPEAVAHLHDPDPGPYLADLFARRGVTHLAVLRNWLAIANQAPLWVADPHPEILEVYAWDPRQTHIVPPAAAAYAEEAAARLAAGDAAAALVSLERGIAVDPRDARLWTLRGGALSVLRRLPEAEEAFGRAIGLFPGSAEARFGLATVLAATGRREEAMGIARALRAEGASLPKLEAFYRMLGGA